MKKVSLVRFLDLINERRMARGLRTLNLQPITFLHDISPDPKTTLDILEEVTQELKADVTRATLKSDYLSPYLRFNLQDIYEAFLRLEAERLYQIRRKLTFALGCVLMVVTCYMLFVEFALMQAFLLATVTSAIFQYWRGAAT